MKYSYVRLYYVIHKKFFVKGFVDKWNRAKPSTEIEMQGRIRSDLCTVPQLMLPGVQLQIKYVKSARGFYLLATKEDRQRNSNFWLPHFMLDE